MYFDQLGHLGDKPRFRVQPPQDLLCRRRAFSWCPLKCRIPSSSVVQQLGFSTSCSRAAQRSAGSAGIFSNTVRVCSQTSFLWWGLFCIKPTIGSSSGSTTPMTSTYSRSTGAAAGPHSSLSSSAFTRSGERFFSRGAFLRRASAVPGSISNPSAAANRSPRRMRNPSSAKRQSGSPTARMSRFSGQPAHQRDR